MSLTVVILTKNEKLHIARAIESVVDFADKVVIVDSGSTDDTCEIARELGAEILENKWVNHATQFNWALDQLSDGTEWVLRLDADEIVTTELADEIRSQLFSFELDIKGVYVNRRMCFMAKPIYWGGVFPISILRLFRHGAGRCENRLMDEHIIVSGNTAEFKGEIVDDNRNTLTWWTDKHNAYASREVVEILNLEYQFKPHETVADLGSGQQAGIKRWIKEKVYARLPIGGRALFYFLYRYVIRLGFLDGPSGTAFHVLQGFWYRYLVDMKLSEVRACMQRDDVDVLNAIQNVLEICPVSSVSRKE